MNVVDIVSSFSGWKITYKTGEVSQIEARKKFVDVDLLLIVGESGKGYNYKYNTTNCRWRPTTQFDVRMSMNGPLQLTFEDLYEITTVAEKARLLLNQK